MSVQTTPTHSRIPLVAGIVASILMASILHADAQGLSIAGIPLPSLCIYDALGHACPGCGTTRAVVFMLQGQFIESLRMQPALPLFLLAGVFSQRRFSLAQPRLARNFAALGLIVACIRLMSHHFS